jgi:hypothetical protein
MPVKVNEESSRVFHPTFSLLFTIEEITRRPFLVVSLLRAKD